MRIALLDPQNARAEHYHAVLVAGGYRCHAFARVKPFLAATLRDTFDLAMIVGPAREPALRQALLTLSRRADAPAVLMLAAQAGEADMIELLDAGADDCLPEPAGGDWLLARTRALLRRGRAARGQDVACLRFDGYRFDPLRCRVDTPEATVALTPKELALALLLFRNPGRDLSRQYLIDGVWARESGPSSRSLDTHVSRIRQKLSLRPEHGYQLAAIYSHGYRLDRTVPATAPDAGDSAPTPRPVAAAPACATPARDAPASPPSGRTTPTPSTSIAPFPVPPPAAWLPTFVLAPAPSRDDRPRGETSAPPLPPAHETVR